MVALGNNRSNGSNLGAFYLNANNALGYSAGYSWRSRASSVLKQELFNFLNVLSWLAYGNRKDATNL